MTCTRFVRPLALVATLVLQLPASGVEDPASTRQDVSLRQDACLFTLTATL